MRTLSLYHCLLLTRTRTKALQRQIASVHEFMGMTSIFSISENSAVQQIATVTFRH